MIYFVWKSTTSTDDIRATGISRFGNWGAISYGTQLYGYIDGHRYDRASIRALNSNLQLLPSENGTLKAVQVTAIEPDFPTAKEGDAFSTVLSTLYTSSGHPAFNPVDDD